VQIENRSRRDATPEVIEICQHFLIGLFHSEPQNTSLGSALQWDHTVRPDAGSPMMLGMILAILKYDVKPGRMTGSGHFENPTRTW
jgi:hypothetical protein